MKKHILITGSTDGIGKLAAIKLAKEGHTIYLHGRNAEKLAQVITEMKTQSDNENTKGFVADFSDLNAVKKMAKQVLQEVPQIDILINNAGIFKSSKSHTDVGFELRFAVNYFAPYLLTNLLLPLLEQGNEPRLINLSSAAQAPVSPQALTGEAQLSMQGAYAQSKLAITMWSFYLAKMNRSINTIAVNPGSLLNTNMVKEGYGYHWSPADKGGDILYDLAISEIYRDSTGKYFDNDKGTFGKAHSDAYEAIKIENLIQATEKIITSYIVN